MPDDMPIVEDNGWSVLGDIWSINFFYENPMPNQPTIMGTLRILFERNSIEIADVITENCPPDIIPENFKSSQLPLAKHEITSMEEFEKEIE